MLTAAFEVMSKLAVASAACQVSNGANPPEQPPVIPVEQMLWELFVGEHAEFALDDFEGEDRSAAVSSQKVLKGWVAKNPKSAT